MRRLSSGLLVFLLLAGGKSVWGQSGGGNAVQFTAEGFYKHTGACSEFSFEWGNGVVASGGEQKPLAFERQFYDRYDGMVWCMNSQPFQMDGSVTSLSFGLGYHFFVEGCRKSEIVDYDSRDHQGSMSVIIDLMDVETGKRVEGTESVYTHYVYVPLGSSYDGSEHREVQVNSSPEWAAIGKKVCLRVAVDLFPNVVRSGAGAALPHVEEIGNLSVGNLK